MVFEDYDEDSKDDIKCPVWKMIGAYVLFIVLLLAIVLSI